MRKISSGSGAPPPPRRRVGGTPCYDSWQKSQKVPDIYLAIRYHGMPALQKNPVDPSAKKNAFVSELEKELQQKFDATDLSPFLLAMKRCLTAFFSFLFLPFYFFFTYIPNLIKSKLIPVCLHWYQKVQAPIAKYILLPLRLAWKRAVELKDALVQKLRQLITAARALFLAYYVPVANAVHAWVGPYWQHAQAQWRALKVYISSTWLKGEARLRELFHPIEKFIEQQLKGAWRRLLAPMQRLFAVIAHETKNLSQSVKAGIAGLAKGIATCYYVLQLVFLWGKIFARYLAKLAGEAYRGAFQAERSGENKR